MNRYGGGDRPDNPKDWSAGSRTWQTREVTTVRPKLEPVLPSLFGTLQQNGLIVENGTAPDALEQLSDDLTKQVNQQAGQMRHGQQMKPITLQEPTIRRVEPSWSPTELGEKVLAFYVEAGTDEGHAPS